MHRLPRTSRKAAPGRMAIWILLLSGFAANALAFEFNFPDVSFPTRRTEDARQVRWQTDGQPFDAYLWWQKGYLWVEVAPLAGSTPRICKGTFWALQRGGQCGRIFPLLSRPKRVSYCGAVRTPTIFMLYLQIAFPTCKVDPAQNFFLALETPESRQQLSIFGNANHKYDEIDMGNRGGGGCLIQTLWEAVGGGSTSGGRSVSGRTK